MSAKSNDDEATLPLGASWKRTHASSDRPLNPKQGAAVCERCGEQAVHTIYEHNDGAQFYSTTIWETRCEACGVYVAHSFQAPG